MDAITQNFLPEVHHFRSCGPLSKHFSLKKHYYCSLVYWKCTKNNCKEYPNCEYIGLTSRKFKNRLGEHKQYIRSELLEEPSGHHFNQPGHTVSHLSGLVLEHVKNSDPFVLKAREFLYIQKFDTFNNGLNKRP